MATLHSIFPHLVTTRSDLRAIEPADLTAALRAGMADFAAMPTHVLFLVAIYPVAGLVIAAAAFEHALIPILFPLAAGFALIGPFAAIGLYELSRRRERGLPATLAHAFAPLSGRSAGAVATVGLVLVLLFAGWLLAALGLYGALYGDHRVESLTAFLGDVLTTPRGWALIAVGNLVGLAFSLIVLAVSAVSLPMIIDRHVDAMTAMETSLTVLRENRRTMLLWGLIVAGLLLLGMLPAFVGLALVLPVLGHATWHLYRRAVASR